MKKMQLLGETNEFIHHMYHVFEKTYFPLSEDIEVKTKKRKLFEMIVSEDGTVTKTVNIGLNNAIEEAERFIESIDLISFENLCNFCDFIRVAEKIVFYKNTADMTLFVDSAVSDKEKKLVLHDKDVTISLQLHQEDIGLNRNSIFGSKEDNKANIIRINVDRAYGKNLQNKFFVVDTIAEYNDDSDVFLINSINILLKRHIKETFLYIIHKIEGKELPI